LLKSKILKTPPSIIFKGENMKKFRFTLKLDIDEEDIEVSTDFEAENYEKAMEFMKDIIGIIDMNNDKLEEIEEE
jgi:hypothetical protein